MMSYHTAKVGKYFIEWHVPTEDIKRLMKERPTALGITVSGMPYGAPGMGPEKSVTPMMFLSLGQMAE